MIEVYVDFLVDFMFLEKVDVNEIVIVRDVGDGRRFMVRISEDEFCGCLIFEVIFLYIYDGYMRCESYIMMNFRCSL